MTTNTVRRVTLIALATTAVIASACSSAEMSPVVQTPTTAAFSALEVDCGSTVGLAASDIGNPARHIEYRAEQRFPMRSTFKTYVVGRILQLADEKRIDLASSVVINAQDVVPGSSTVASHTGGTMTIAELATATLQYSDNTAGILLLNMIGGRHEFNVFVKSLGDDQSHLDESNPDLGAAVTQASTTPKSLATGYRQLLVGDALSSTSRQQLILWMAGSKTSDKRIRAALPAGWISADKTGSGAGVANNVGLVTSPQGARLMLAILTSSRTDVDANEACVADAAGQAISALTS